eukprot:CAMPEP_0175041646 /NCGR_PEP_ID=MMETSP0052_2-20121109/2049_1 /TAXON_ID=51329 ORGANISM="Polytomella parva, Strain SAG 63-3" /NCGR_SAMPLE_ID=MMETSP0052_2 /ASSEMBLY_ACC=CAM_ASM_000194 /LENGTH=696 /DNA_ID=CAMNT_0016304221 /DNA_START=65 /DNA_END=2151 /DNA_ORIENTATION=+
MTEAKVDIVPLKGQMEMVKLPTLAGNVLARIHADFSNMLNNLSNHPVDSRERRATLLKHLHSTRQQLLRLQILSSNRRWAVLKECATQKGVLACSSHHALEFCRLDENVKQTSVGRQMFFQPIFDVTTALEVLTTGGCSDLPEFIRRRPPFYLPLPPSLSCQRRRLYWVTHLIRLRLLYLLSARNMKYNRDSSNLLPQPASSPPSCCRSSPIVGLPSNVQVVEVRRGYVLLRAEGLYEAMLSLSPVLCVPKTAELLEAGLVTVKANSLGVSVVGEVDDSMVSKSLLNLGKDMKLSNEGESLEQKSTSNRSDSTASASTVSGSILQEQRWTWILLGFKVLNNGPGIEPSQERNLTQFLNQHMHWAADAAAYASLREQLGLNVKAGEAGEEGEADKTDKEKREDGEKSEKEDEWEDVRNDGVKKEGQKYHLFVKTEKHTVEEQTPYQTQKESSALNSSPSLPNPLTPAAAVAAAAADEVSRPLLVMHQILSDVSGRILVKELSQEARELSVVPVASSSGFTLNLTSVTAGGGGGSGGGRGAKDVGNRGLGNLKGSGETLGLEGGISRLGLESTSWKNNVTVTTSSQLRPGIQIKFWIQSPVIMDLSEPEIGSIVRPLSSPSVTPPVSSAAAPANWANPEAPYIEIGLNRQGALEVLLAASTWHAPRIHPELSVSLFARRRRVGKGARGGKQRDPFLFS